MLRRALEHFHIRTRMCVKAHSKEGGLQKERLSEKDPYWSFMVFLIENSFLSQPPSLLYDHFCWNQNTKQDQPSYTVYMNSGNVRHVYLCTVRFNPMHERIASFKYASHGGFEVRSKLPCYGLRCLALTSNREGRYHRLQRACLQYLEGCLYENARWLVENVAVPQMMA